MEERTAIPDNRAIDGPVAADPPCGVLPEGYTARVHPYGGLAVTPPREHRLREPDRHAAALALVLLVAGLAGIVCVFSAGSRHFEDPVIFFGTMALSLCLVVLTLALATAFVAFLVRPPSSQQWMVRPGIFFVRSEVRRKTLDRTIENGSLRLQPSNGDTVLVLQSGRRRSVLAMRRWSEPEAPFLALAALLSEQTGWPVENPSAASTAEPDAPPTVPNLRVERTGTTLTLADATPGRNYLFQGLFGIFMAVMVLRGAGGIFYFMRRDVKALTEPDSFPGPTVAIISLLFMLAFLGVIAKGTWSAIKTVLRARRGGDVVVLDTERGVVERNGQFLARLEEISAVVIQRLGRGGDAGTSYTFRLIAEIPGRKQPVALTPERDQGESMDRLAAWVGDFLEVPVRRSHKLVAKVSVSVGSSG